MLTVGNPKFRMRNVTANCALNTIVQALRSIGLSNLPTDSNCGPIWQALHALVTSPTAYEDPDLLVTMLHFKFAAGFYHCALEMWDYMWSTASVAIQAQIGCYIITVEICVLCTLKIEREENIYCGVIDIDDSSPQIITVGQAIANWRHSERIECKECTKCTQNAIEQGEDQEHHDAIAQGEIKENTPFIKNTKHIIKEERRMNKIGFIHIPTRWINTVC